MNPAPPKPKDRPFLDLLEESLHLLRTAPLSITLNFYFGTIPFVMGLLFFCMDFSQASYSGTEAALAALGMTALYAWMKTWQAIFCQQLRIWLCTPSSHSWNTKQFFNIFFQQLIIQATSFLVIPLSLVITLPFAWTYAFYQNISILGDGSEPSLRKLCAKAWHQAGLWPKQNHLGIWLISPVLFVVASTFLLGMFYIFARMNPYWMQAPQLYLIAIAVLLLLMGFIANPCGAVIALNFGILLYLIPQILKMLTGIETIFTLNASYMLSATFLITVCSLTYLTLEPLVKSFYVLRCFYGDSIRTGEDLKAGLQTLSFRRLAQAAALLALVFVQPLSFASAQTGADPAPMAVSPPVLSPEELDQSIDRVMSDRKYTWRSPHETKSAPQEKGFFGYFLDALMEKISEITKSLGDLIGPIIHWLRHLFEPEEKNLDQPELTSSIGKWSALSEMLLWIFSFLLLVLLVRALLLRFRKKAPAKLVAQSLTPSAQPDLASENISASDLESDEWENLARRLMEEGQFRLALRAFFLSTLSFLGRQELLQLKRHKTNHDYERELRRQILSHPDTLRCFSQNLSLYERSWYGSHEATPEVLQIFTQNQQLIRHSLET